MWFPSIFLSDQPVEYINGRQVSSNSTTIKLPNSKQNLIDFLLHLFLYNPSLQAGLQFLWTKSNNINLNKLKQCFSGSDQRRLSSPG